MELFFSIAALVISISAILITLLKKPKKEIVYRVTDEAAIDIREIMLTNIRMEIRLDDLENVVQVKNK